MAKIKVQSGAVFERHEKKYMVSPAQYAELKELLADRMRQDHYGLHTICTLYYDTDDYEVIRRSLDKPAFKEKLRLRSYGVPSEDDTVYLELKKKLDGVTYKRRAALTLREGRDYVRSQRQEAPRGQILAEIDWYIRQRQLSEKLLLCYDRVAFFGVEDSELRVTFDRDIRWRNYSLDLGEGDYGSPLLIPGTRLMEIKTMGALPLWLCEALSSLRIYPQSFSKYGEVYKRHLMGREERVRHAG